MREFFGFGGYNRTPEGYMSWQHITFVTSLMVIMIALAIILGLNKRHKSEQEKNKVLVIAAILIDAFEIFKIVLLCFRGHSLNAILLNLPLFLCSIQLITIPLAAFCKGRLKEASLDFVFIFGILGAVAGTYGAGQNYSCYPVLFSSLYIVISGMASMKKENILISFGILIGFCVLAYIADITIPYNYMFLMRGDGTPYDIFYNLVNGNRVLYPMIVVVLFLAYISIFYLVYFLIQKKKAK